MQKIDPDPQILGEVWEGCIPIVVQLASNDLTSPSKPPPYYLSVPRYSYITLVSAPIKQCFSDYVPPINDEMWFDSEGTPLKWHYPIGVLYDSYGRHQMPWPITVHFQGFPSDQLLRCPDEDTIKSHFLNTLKEANCMKYGDIDNVNALSVGEHTDLWAGIFRNEKDRFWKINHKLARGVDRIVNVTVRIIRPQQRFMLQEPFPPRSTDGKEHTLADILEKLVPDVTVTRQNGQATTRHNLLIQGIVPTLDMSLLWLTYNLSNTDNFLYIIILPP